MFELRRTMSNLGPKENISTLLFLLINEYLPEKKIYSWEGFGKGDIPGKADNITIQMPDS